MPLVVEQGAYLGVFRVLLTTFFSRCVGSQMIRRKLGRHMSLYSDNVLLKHRHLYNFADRFFFKGVNSGFKEPVARSFSANVMA